MIGRMTYIFTTNKKCNLTLGASDVNLVAAFWHFKLFCFPEQKKNKLLISLDFKNLLSVKKWLLKCSIAPSRVENLLQWVSNNLFWTYSKILVKKNGHMTYIFITVFFWNFRIFWPPAVPTHVNLQTSNILSPLDLSF